MEETNSRASLHSTPHTWGYSLSGSDLPGVYRSADGRLEIMVMEIFADQTNPDFKFMTRSAINEHIKTILAPARRIKRSSVPKGSSRSGGDHALPTLHARDLRKVRWMTINHVAYATSARSVCLG